MKQKMKYVLFLLSAALIITALPLCAVAQEEEEPVYEETTTSPLQEADAVFTEFEVLENAGYTINMYHAYQGPLCDAAFLLAQGKNMLVTDYFNVSVNNNLRIYEIASYVKLRVKIPKDLQQKNRTWWMICISRNGVPYFFDDVDDDDATITWNANRFYAYAMCYTDEVVEKKEVKEEPEEVDENPRSRMHSINDSKTISGKAQEDFSMLNQGEVIPEPIYGPKTNRLPKMRSGMKDAVERQKKAGGGTVYYFTL